LLRGGFVLPWKMQFNHGWTRMDTDAKPVQKIGISPGS